MYFITFFGHAFSFWSLRYYQICWYFIYSIPFLQQKKNNDALIPLIPFNLPFSSLKITKGTTLLTLAPLSIAGMMGLSILSTMQSNITHPTRQGFSLGLFSLFSFSSFWMIFLPFFFFFCSNIYISNILNIYLYL